MNYELAKKLKDANFPQVLRLGSIFCPTESGQGECFASDVDGSIWLGLLYPTLSELIEACGEKFGSLFRNGAIVRLDLPIRWGCFDGDGDPSVEDFSTPEEAVANLWLALNEKK